MKIICQLKKFEENLYMKCMNFVMLMICEMCEHTYGLIGIKKKFGFCEHDL